MTSIKNKRHKEKKVPSQQHQDQEKKVASIWFDIDQLHLKYLKSENNVQKIELRKLLEKKTKEYLCLVTQQRKFVSLYTGDIISNSSSYINNFCLSKAAEAFQCIEQYAANLLKHLLWKADHDIQCHEIYTQDIESVLIGADSLFFEMGYTKDNQNPNLWVLPFNSAVKSDCVIQVARDCLLAKMEAVILQEIYVGVTCQFELSFEELLQYRRDHVGSPEEATRELLFQKSEIRRNLSFPYSTNVYQPWFPSEASLDSHDLQALENKTKAELEKISKDLRSFNKKNQDLIDNETARILNVTKKLDELLKEKKILERNIVNLEKEKKNVNEKMMSQISSLESELKVIESKNQKKEDCRLRPIVIDGPNVAMAHGSDQIFSITGIEISVRYFIERGHKTVVAFIPQHYQTKSEDRCVLEKLKRSGNLVFTPSRMVGNRRISSYDDRMLLNYAIEEGAVVVSRDEFKDLYEEDEKYRETIANRVLQPTFIGDKLIFPDDPLGRHGPRLQDFLKF